ncbi:MAG: energy transducer TonB [Pseudomonadota bacterium]
MRFLIFAIVLAIFEGANVRTAAQEIDVTEIVEAHDAFKERDSSANRKKLLKALQAYQDDATMESVQAHLDLLGSDAASGRHGRMRESALAAAVHLEPISDILPKQYIEAKYVAAVALFNESQKPGAMLEMAHVEGFLRAHADENGEQPEWAIDLDWKAEAWRYAMEAYFISVGDRYPNDAEIEAAIDGYKPEMGWPEDDIDAAEVENELPHCAGQMIQKPKLRYRAGQAFRGMYGAVILGLEFDEDGNVINPKVHAAVPLEEFDAQSLRAVSQWRLEPEDPTQVGVTCRLEYTNVVQPITFILD